MSGYSEDIDQIIKEQKFSESEFKSIGEAFYNVGYAHMMLNQFEESIEKLSIVEKVFEITVQQFKPAFIAKTYYLLGFCQDFL